MNILYITFHYPPNNVTGAFRPLRFSKHLTKFGSQLTILTIDDKKYNYNPKLVEQIPNDVEIVRVRSPFAYRVSGKSFLYKPSNSIFTKIKNLAIRYVKDIFLSPDIQIVWALKAFPTALRVIKKRKIDHIVVSLNPASSAILAYFLKLFTGVPYTLDFRDYWEVLAWQTRQTIIRQKLNRFWAKLTVNKAANVVGVSDTLVNYYRDTYPKQKHCYTVTNSVDPDEFIGLDFSQREPNKVRRIFYGGTFEVDSYMYDPVIIFRALRNIKTKHGKDFVLDIFGNENTKAKELIVKFGLEDNIVLHGYRPKEELIEYMARADIFLHFQYPFFGKEVIPLKTFDYIYCRKPILTASSTEGEMAKRIVDFKCGIACDGTDVEEVTKAFLQLWDFDTKYFYTEEFEKKLETMTAFYTARQMSDILNGKGI